MPQNGIIPDVLLLDAIEQRVLVNAKGRILEWPGPDPLGILNPRELHLWWFDLTKIPPGLETLKPEFANLTHAPPQPSSQTHQKIQGRTILHWLLRCYGPTSSPDLCLSYGPHGKPSLIEPQTQRPHLQFSWSHSHTHAIAALSHSIPLGIDLELVRPCPQALRIAQRYFESSVLTHLQTLTEPERSMAFLQQWTQWEAGIKAVGGSIFQPQSYHPHLTQTPQHQWPIQLGKNPGYVGTVIALSPQAWTLRVYHPHWATKEI